jgi:hypothetical protein
LSATRGIGGNDLSVWDIFGEAFLTRKHRILPLRFNYKSALQKSQEIIRNKYKYYLLNKNQDFLNADLSKKCPIRKIETAAIAAVSVDGY